MLTSIYSDITSRPQNEIEEEQSDVQFITGQEVSQVFSIVLYRDRKPTREVKV